MCSYVHHKGATSSAIDSTPIEPDQITEINR